MNRKLAWLLITVGAVVLFYNAYLWWGQIRIAVMDPKLARSISDDWDDRSYLPALTKVGETKQTSPVTHMGDKIGELVIPKLGAILPIVEGTDDKSLKKGVGLYRGFGTVKPNQTGHVVLSGHRDTVFRNVGKLVDGDKLFVKFNGSVYTYQIRKRWVTHAEDRTVIVPINRPVLSLTTCYPFDYVGDAPDRYIIQADLVKVETGKNYALEGR
ncbi:class D sortase [Paenactinomyces guangxiensis]|uniref:Class D sortase n=1 Tax=Paenactinomyces guangxiensis TaxID=1490290 RepID=A0A7W1WT18_9BACL|nr:class D sortase [Paenactinomyces guangxiensis]MBA4495311.1 class D sortase [Paenactinomyces guangxiensis]MBH8592567.1 class D sortase [Paenactinomyces guangxiensis]